MSAARWSILEREIFEGLIEGGVLGVEGGLDLVTGDEVLDGDEGLGEAAELDLGGFEFDLTEPGEELGALAAVLAEDLPQALGLRGRLGGGWGT